MTEPTLMQRLIRRIVPDRFFPKPRKSLRSPKRTKKLLRWADRTNHPVAHTFIIGWPKLLTAILVAYFLLTGPDVKGLGPMMSDISKGISIFLSFANFLDLGWRTVKSWRVRRRRELGRKVRAAEVRLFETQAMLRKASMQA